MSIDYSQSAIPKGKTRKQVKARKDREDAKAMRAFQDAVWERAKAWIGEGYDYARCQGCALIVYRDRNPLGHVHHKISRRHKASRHDPNNGVILCRRCHNDVHGREF